MALRLAAAGRQAQNAGGTQAQFADDQDLQVVFRAGTQPADVDTVSSDGVIATLIGGANAYSAPSDDDTTSSMTLAANLTGNATAAHDYSVSGEQCAEIFIGAGRTSADKFGDFTVDGAGGSSDFNWDSDVIANGGLLTISALTFQKT